MMPRDLYMHVTESWQSVSRGSTICSELLSWLAAMGIPLFVCHSVTHHYYHHYIIFADQLPLP